MTAKFRMAIPVLVAMIFLSCKHDDVTLSYTSAKDEVPQLGNLVFRFDKPVFPDSLLNSWDSAEYITFQPAIQGHYRWNAPDELVFSPSVPLLPATGYTAKIKAAVLHYSRYSDVKDGGPITFHTAPLSLIEVRATWVLVDENSRRAVPQMNLQFNYPVKSEELKEKLKVEEGGSSLPFSVLNSGSSTQISIRFNSFRSEDRDYELKLSVDKGIKPDRGQNGTEDVMREDVTIPSPYVLNINNVESEHDGTEGLVRIYTSQQVTQENTSSFIKFSPAVHYNVEYTDYGIQLRSEKFNPENSYTFSINKGLRGKIGGVLKEEYNGSVAFGKMESDIKFTNNKAIYLSKLGEGKIEVKITSTPKVRLVVSKIYENNLLMAGRYGYEPADNGSYKGSGEEDETAAENVNAPDAVSGDVIYSRELDTRSLPGSANGKVLNLAEYLKGMPEAKGIYHVMVRSSKDYWVRDSRFISYSDIGLIAKQGFDRIYVFANSIKSANPLPGVTINIYGANNQLLGTGATGNDGMAEITTAIKNFAGFKPAMIIAKTADDFTYLPFNASKINTSRFEVGGRHMNTTGLDAFVYQERDIYRPGEKINFSVLLRNKVWKSPGEIPVRLRFVFPNGKEMKTLRKTVNDQGALDGSVDIPVSAITGTYNLEVYSSNDVLLATANFMIEEFVPDRIKLSANLDKPVLSPAGVTVLSVNAMDFFGPPAANRKFETEIQVHQKQFASKKFRDFNFTLTNEKEFNDKDVKEGRTDASGNASVVYTVPDLYRNLGLLQVSFFTTVFDETGRPVSRNVSASIYTQQAFNGIKDDGYYYYNLNQPVTFQLVSVDKDDNPVTAQATVKVMKHEYKTVLSKNGDYFRYESQKEDKVVSEKEVSVSNNTPYTFIPRSPGDYEIRIFRPGSNIYVSKSFYSYGNWGGDNSSFEVNTEGHIDVEMDKAYYKPGDHAKLLFKTPFSGKMLVTMETDHVLSHQYLDVANKTASLDLLIGNEEIPNMFVTATLFRPHEISDIPLTVAHGFQNIRVQESSRKIPVTITALKSVRSNTRQKVSVRAIPGSYITLAAVDNGVLQVTDFKTPDPYNYYYQSRALQIAAYDIYPLLFPELKARLSSTGGDGSVSLDKRVNPMPARRFKILSYWSGLKKVGNDGTADFEFFIPKFSGQVRLMAIAFRDEKFGSAEAVTSVADPVVLSTALPRFMSPGDTVLVAVTISNTTSHAVSGNVGLNATKTVTVIGNNVLNITLNPNSEQRINFKVTAGPVMNTASITSVFTAAGEKFSDQTDISVRPPSPLQKVSASGSILAGNRQSLLIPQNDFIKGTFNYSLIISRSPVAQMADQLKYLLQYPYGCTEQTVSVAFPQLYYGDFADLFGLQVEGRKNAASNIMEAVRKIKMRQLYTGGITMWDGEGTEDWWATIYAAHFLLEAKKAGYDIDNSLIETILGYLTNRLKVRQMINYYYNRNQQKKIAPKEVAYSLYVLSLAGRPQVSAMNYYKANNQLLALDSRYLLSASYAVSGDKQSFSALLPGKFGGEESEKQTGGSFYSPLRDEAISLNSLIDVDPGNAQIPFMAKHVSDRLKTDPYPNTQERAFSFLALGKLARMAAHSEASADVMAGGKLITVVSAKDWKGTGEQIGSNKIDLEVKGAGRIYYSWVAEGISASGAFREEDHYIKVRRHFFDRFGHEISRSGFKQNDLIIVQLTLEKAFNGPVENIVISDILPAGFEIENPRTKELPGMDWIKDESRPVAMDVRDDRINLFVNATVSKQKYYYAVRAVSPGVFRQGPVSADAMYNGEIHSYNGAQVIKVTGE